jgi:protein gp37
LSAEEQQAVLEQGAQGESSLNKQDTSHIEWARWSWNPVTGCKHDCSYCYARDIAARYYKQGFVPAIVPHKLGAPAHTKVPVDAAFNVPHKNVFTCSMADLFGKWVPREWIEAVLAQVSANPQWNFLFLTKFPIRLTEFRFPPNAWLGTTVDAQARIPNAERAFAQIEGGVKWLSCEPLLERLTFSRLDLFDWVVIGGASASTQTPEFRPRREWVEHLERQAQEAGCRIYEKTNLVVRRTEYPGQADQRWLSMPVDQVTLACPKCGHEQRANTWKWTRATVDVPRDFKMGYLQRDVLPL